MWIGPGVLSLILAGELAYLLVASPTPKGLVTITSIGPARVGKELFGPYLLAVELASMLLPAALAGAYHLGRDRETAE